MFLKKAHTYSSFLEIDIKGGAEIFTQNTGNKWFPRVYVCPLFYSTNASSFPSFRSLPL